MAEAADAAFFPPLAPTPAAGGTRFRVVSGAAVRMRLLLYPGPGAQEPDRILELERADRGGDRLWEIFVPGVGPGQHYAWSAEGPGLDSSRPLLDPCALALSGPTRFGADDPDRVFAPRGPRRDPAAYGRFKCVVVAPPPTLAWKRPGTALRDSILYELHLRGFTRHASSGVAHPGTYRGLVEKIPYLTGLGVTAIELLPPTEFDETETRPGGAERGTRHVNFWGYSPMSWFAPNRRYAADAERPEGPLEEFRAMVRSLHAAGIEVVVDMVFNHTAEMDETGPILGFRGLDDGLYYLPGPRPGTYANHSGCGNTVNVQHPLVRRLILDALRWWRHGLGVDGFRFDLASILVRDERGEIRKETPLLREIEEDPALAGAHLIAEPWDAAGGYLLGHWPGGPRWALWNDRFRDDVRRAWFGEPRLAGVLASRLCGSSDLLAGPGSGPPRGVNFVTSHDGFTLRDAVTYGSKRNDANGEGGRDGNSHEPSFDHGVDGPAGAPAVLRARERTRRNMIASLLLSQGVPLLLAGDEMGRSQGGNNNAYCHDDAISWLDWDGLRADATFTRFVRRLIGLRKSLPSLRRRSWLVGGGNGGPGPPDASWLGPGGGEVDWHAARGCFGLLLFGRGQGEAELLLLVNLRETPIAFELPPPAWRLLVDTAATPPGDCPDPPTGVASPHRLAARSLSLLQRG